MLSTTNAMKPAESLEKFKQRAKLSLKSGPGEIKLTPEEVQEEPLLRENPDRYVALHCRVYIDLSINRCVGVLSG